jgi:hypothetical protein
VANAARGGVDVDRVKLRGLLAQDRLMQALISRDLAELDAALDSVVRPSSGWTAAEARMILVAVLLLAVDDELPGDRQLDVAAYRRIIGELHEFRQRFDLLLEDSHVGIALVADLDARISGLAGEISRQVRPIGYRDPYEAEISAFEQEHVPGLRDRRPPPPPTPAPTPPPATPGSGRSAGWPPGPRSPARGSGWPPPGSGRPDR